MRSVCVPISQETREKLIRAAQREFRDPRQQAAKLLAEALEQAEQRGVEPCAPGTCRHAEEVAHASGG